MELSAQDSMSPVHVRGEAYLKALQGKNAAAEFQEIIDHPVSRNNEQSRQTQSGHCNPTTRVLGKAATPREQQEEQEAFSSVLDCAIETRRFRACAPYNRP